MIAHTTLGVRALRIEISNMANTQPLEIGSAHVALHTGDGAIVPGTDRALKFSGNESFVVPPGALLVSDLVDLLKGNVTGSVDMPDPAKTYYLCLTGDDVLTPADSYAIVALGDSITDGLATTVDGNATWPAWLTKQLAAVKRTRNVAVLNQGISGNQVVRDGAGVSALARFDRDVPGRPGVKWIILLEGINDINIRGRSTGPDALTSDELIAGYRQIIERAHVTGIKMRSAIIMPEEEVPTASERGEEIRQTVNRWNRAKGNFDAVVDFDLILQDRSHPARLNPAFNPGDHTHPDDAGNKAMADAIDLILFAGQ